MRTRRVAIGLAAAVFCLILAIKGLTRKEEGQLSHLSSATAQVVEQQADPAQQEAMPPQEDATALEIERLTQRNEQLEAYVRRLIDNVTRLEAAQKQDQTALDAARQGEQQAQQSLSEVQQQLQAAQTQQTQWQERHRSTSEMLAAVQQQLQQCKTDAQAALAEAAERHRQALETEQQEQQSLRTALTAAQQEQQATQEELKQAQQHLQQCTTDAQVALAEAAERHRVALAAKQQALQAVEATLATVRQELQETLQQLEQTQRELQQAQVQSAQWQERYHEADAARTTAQRHLKAGDEAARMRLQADMEARVRQITQLRGVYEQFTEQLQEEIQAQAVTVQQHGDHVMIRMTGKAMFSQGHASIRSKGQVMLKKISKVLQDLSAYNVHVGGHTDSLPLNKPLRQRWSTNWALSTSRAAAVVHCLERLGVAPERLTAEGHGPYRPLTSNDTRQGRSQNRRIEIIVQPRA